ncbi:hypothetical protein ACFV3O_20720, partial [Streptomyces albidoflavus]
GPPRSPPRRAPLPPPPPAPPPSPVLIQVFTARWNGDPATLHLTEGVLLHWFRPEVMPRLRLAPSTLELVHRHAGLPAPTGWPVSPQEPPAGETGADPPGRHP